MSSTDGDRRGHPFRRAALDELKSFLACPERKLLPEAREAGHEINIALGELLAKLITIHEEAEQIRRDLNQALGRCSRYEIDRLTVQARNELTRRGEEQT